MTGKVIRFDLWPEADRRAWEAALAEGDIFDGQGPAAHLSAGSRKSICGDYGRWIGWLRVKEPGALDLEPAERVEPLRFRRYLETLEAEVSPAGRLNYAKHLYDAIRHMAPDRDWSWIKDIVWRLADGVRPRSKAERLVTPERLIQLGLEFMAYFDADNPTPEGRRAYRDGLLIAILAMRPIRRRNLAAIRIGQHLVRTGSGWHLLFSEEETKNRQPLEMHFPSDLVPALERYLAEIRPLFPGAENHDGLWTSDKGRPMSDGALYDAVLRRTAAALGTGINLHFFRHIAATEIAQVAPEQIGIARDLLGHSDLRALDRHYIQADQAQAASRFQAALLAARGDSRQARRSRRRRTREANRCAP